MKGTTRVFANRIAAVCCLATVPVVARHNVFFAAAARSPAPAPSGQSLSGQAQAAHSARAEKAAQGWVGFGLLCDGQCEMVSRNGTGTWTFRSAPIIAELSPGSPAALAGLRVGDTLIALDGVSMIAEAAGVRLARLEPGQKLTMTYRRGTAGTATIVTSTQPEGDPADGAGPLAFSGTLGGTEIEVRGGRPQVTMDKSAGTLEISGREITVRVRAKK
jgi:membrane-associated protease RseP (regulator of RpoE activity)